MRPSERPQATARPRMPVAWWWSRSVPSLAATIGMLAAAVGESGAAEPQRVPLWEQGAPGDPDTRPADEPELLFYRPPKESATRTAVVICPGGGYHHLAMQHEGEQVAAWLNSLGVSAFVLKYRNLGSGHRHPVPMLDGQRAIRTVRACADEWGIDPQRVGVLGFSAGGHLASTLATQFDDGDPRAADPVDRAGSRPDFLILCYPVITMTEQYLHRGSRESLLGESADEDLARRMSSERQVTSRTPPTFIFQTDEDTSVPAENCIAFYLALRRAGVPAEMHIYQNGRHGLGLADGVAGTNDWPARCRAWMELRGLLEPARGAPARP